MDVSRFKPDPSRSALVVIDIQEKLCNIMPQEVLPQTLKNVSILIQGAQAFNIPVLLTEQYPKGLGPTVPLISKLLPDVTPHEKLVFSCYREHNFRKTLEAKDARDVFLCGIETHICVLQTALDLLADDYRVFIPLDAVISRFKHNWKQGVALMQQAGAIVGTTETFLFMMLEESGTDRFKAISRLIR